MRVLYFHQYFSTPRGASGTRSYEMARRLSSRGHQVLIVCGSAERGETGLSSAFVNGRRRGVIDLGVEVLEFDLGYSNRHSFAKRTLSFLKFAMRSVWVALFEPCDIVFATTTPLTASFPGIAARWLRRKPFVFEVRDLWPELPRAMGVIRNPLLLSALSIVEWCSYHSARRVIGLAPGIVDGIIRRGVSPTKVSLVPNGCDFEIFSGATESWRPAGVDSADLLAVFAGAHGIANGLDAVLDAACELKRRGRHDIKIVLIGSGKVKARLATRVIDEALTNVVIHAPVSKHRLGGLMSATDVGLQILANVPAFYNGTSPNKFFDYIAAGLPVLINYDGWLSEKVTTDNCGFAVPPNNPVAFADALVRAADDRSSLREMGRRAHALAKREFDRDVLADRFVDILESSISA
jgi:glycosyltransferase involved in cell wall biosynthesis